MELNVLTMFCDEEGNPRSEECAVDFRSNDHGLALNAAVLSAPENCRNLQFVELPVGFERSDRIPDIGQVAVCLAGRIKVSGASGDSHLLEAGGVLRLLQGQESHHTIAVVGDTPAHLMVVQLK